MIKSYGDLGLEVHITEIDVSCSGCSGNSDSTQNVKQAQVYKKALEACIVDNPGVCTAFLSWGITDEHTWKGVWNHPLPLDENYKRKPAYYKMREVLRAEKTRREEESSRQEEEEERRRQEEEEERRRQEEEEERKRQEEEEERQR